MKARYVEFTDETFSARKVRSADWTHLGLLGPVIRAEVRLVSLSFPTSTLLRYTLSLCLVIKGNSTSSWTPYHGEAFHFRRFLMDWRLFLHFQLHLSPLLGGRDDICGLQEHGE